MFWHNFKYTILINLRDRSTIFWSLIFVIILGTLFRVTFGDAYEKSDLTKNIKVAVYIEDEAVAGNFSGIIENISLDEENGEKLLDVTYADSMEAAEEILEQKATNGLFYSENGELKLIIKGNSVRASILGSIVSQYHQIVTIMETVAVKAPDKIDSAVISLLTMENNNTEKQLTSGSMDVFMQYFYNLIAMSCLFASFAGITFTIRNQGNLSDIGARKCVSNTRRLVSTVSGLLANVLMLFICTIISMLYLILIGIDFGDKTGAIIVVVLVGTLVGTTMGYFIGSIGRISTNIKDALGVSVSLVLCFLSGLMVGDMRMVVEQVCPAFNRINPAVLISDSFYALNIYEDYDRYTTNIVTMLITALIFIVGGVLMGRRKKYASL